MTQVVYTTEDIVKAISVDVVGALLLINQSIKELTVAITTQVIHVKVVAANAPPQYTGPEDLGTQVQNSTLALEGMDPDGDPLTWSVEPNALATCNAAGVLTFTGVGEGDITVKIDDGKP